MAVAPPLRYRAEDANGNPVSGAKLYFYDAGTTTTRNVYSDSGLASLISQPVLSDSSGWFQEIYIDGTAGNYRVRKHDASDVPLHDDYDNVAPPVTGTVPLSQGGTGGTTASTARTNLSVPSQSQHDAVDTRLATAEATIAANIDSSTEALTWASTVAIDHSSQSAFSITLAGNTTFSVSGLRDGRRFQLYITQDATGGRSTTFPAAFIFMGGKRVDTTASKTTLIDGVVVGTSIIAICSGADGAWDYAVWNQQTSGTGGGSSTTGSWQTVPLNTIGFDYLSIGAPSSNAVSLAAGTYEFEWVCPFWETGATQTRLYDGSSSIAAGQSVNLPGSTNNQASSVSCGAARASFTSTTSVSLQYQCGIASANEGLGRAASFGDERYALLKIKKLSD